MSASYKKEERRYRSLSCTVSIGECQNVRYAPVMSRRGKIWIGAGVGLVVAAAGAAIWLQRGGEEDVRTIRAERGVVKQEVSFTGRLVAKQEVSLGFELGGTVSAVLVEVGQTVTAGQSLARIDSRLASLELARAAADEAAAQEQRYLAWQAAEQDWEKTKRENAKTLEGKRQAVRNAKTEVDQQRTVVGETDEENGESALTATALLTQRVKESAYVAAQKSLEETQAAIDAVNARKRAAADEAKAVYEATRQASGAVAGLSALEAARQLASVKVSKTTITAPFDGVITAREVEPGQYVAPGTVALSVATTGELELVADVPETDAAKLSGGAQAAVTFDAYGSAQEWAAEVVSIAPAARIIEGVPTFEVKLRLVSSDARFKPGLTANIIVYAAERKGVLALPRRAVITRTGKEFVRVKDGAAEREVEIQTGLLGSDGRVEIISGLTGGEEVVINGTAAR